MKKWKMNLQCIVWSQWLPLGKDSDWQRVGRAGLRQVLIQFYLLIWVLLWAVFILWKFQNLWSVYCFVDVYTSTKTLKHTQPQDTEGVRSISTGGASLSEQICLDIPAKEIVSILTPEEEQRKKSKSNIKLWQWLYLIKSTTNKI